MRQPDQSTEKVTVIGEILFDVFPEEKVPGGAPFNFAYHMKNLGFEVHFCTRIADDRDGREILRILEERGFSRDCIQVEKNGTTGKVLIELQDEGDHRFEIVENVAYDHLELSPILEGEILVSTQLVYVGTLIQRTSRGRETIQGLLEQRPVRSRVFYDLNLRQHYYHREVIDQTLQNTHIFKCNREELTTLKELFGLQGDDQAVVQKLMERYSLETVAVTDGAAPAVLYREDRKWRIQPPRVGDFTDSVGGGDAFSAVLAAGILRGWPPGRIVKSAVKFAAEICRIRGALPSAPDIYSEIMEKK